MFKRIKEKIESEIREILKPYHKRMIEGILLKEITEEKQLRLTEEAKNILDSEVFKLFMSASLKDATEELLRDSQRIRTSNGIKHIPLSDNEFMLKDKSVRDSLAIIQAMESFFTSHASYKKQEE